MTLQTRIRLANRIVKVLAVCALIALVAIILSLTPSPAKAQCATCPSGQCAPPVVYAQPLYRAPVREAIAKTGRAIYEFVTPQGYVYQGYIRRPLAPMTRERALRNAAYWEAQAAKLAPQQ